MSKKGGDKPGDEMKPNKDKLIQEEKSEVGKVRLVHLSKSDHCGCNQLTQLRTYQIYEYVLYVCVGCCYDNNNIYLFIYSTNSLHI